MTTRSPKDIDLEIRKLVRSLNENIQSDLFGLIGEFLTAERKENVVDIRINCPECGTLHVDEGEFENKPHHTHACQNCGLTWRPSVSNTRGVKFLPGFKN